MTKVIIEIVLSDRNILDTPLEKEQSYIILIEVLQHLNIPIDPPKPLETRAYLQKQSRGQQPTGGTQRIVFLLPENVPQQRVTWLSQTLIERGIEQPISHYLLVLRRRRRPGSRAAVVVQSQVVVGLLHTGHDARLVTAVLTATRGTAHIREHVVADIREIVVPQKRLKQAQIMGFLLRSRVLQIAVQLAFIDK